MLGRAVRAGETRLTVLDRDRVELNLGGRRDRQLVESVAGPFDERLVAGRGARRKLRWGSGG